MALQGAPHPFHEVIESQAKRAPGTSALRFEGRVLTYGDLASQSAAAAAALWHELGVRPGARVAWLGANHPAQIVLLFAAARIGAILLPLNFRLATGELRTLIEDCQPSHLVHDAAFADAAGALAAVAGVECHGIDTLAGQGEVPLYASANSPLLLVYTSGTTRRPKAAMHTQGNLLANMEIAAGVQAMTSADRIATMLPMFHVGGLCIQTLPALFVGAEVILHPRFAPDAALDCFERDRPTLTLQVPATMKGLVDHPRWRSADLSSLRAVWAGSSLLPANLIEAFHARGIPVCNVYGSTETGPFSIALPPAAARTHVGSCGWPAPGVEARLAAGELWIRAPNVARTYWPNQPTCDADGWFHTGDLARQDPDGSFTIIGRSKDLIISGGENIHPAEIEAVLAEHPAVLECAAFGIHDEQWGEVVGVAVVPQTAREFEAELHAHLSGRIARYKLPRHWLWVDALPKTALGKVQRPELQALAKSRR